jgi:hypothetical protein
LAERYTLHCDVVELGGVNAMPTRAADRPRLYYNIFLNFDGSVLAYLVAPEEEEKRGLK